jgi:hypothetical protein
MLANAGGAGDWEGDGGADGDSVGVIVDDAVRDEEEDTEGDTEADTGVSVWVAETCCVHTSTLSTSKAESKLLSRTLRTRNCSV